MVDAYTLKWTDSVEQIYNIKMDKNGILIVDDEIFNINALMIMLRCFTSINPDEFCDIAMDGLDSINKVH